MSLPRTERATLAAAGEPLFEVAGLAMSSTTTLCSFLNRTGFVGGLFQREDGAHGTTKQVLTGAA